MSINTYPFTLLDELESKIYQNIYIYIYNL